MKKTIPALMIILGLSTASSSMAAVFVTNPIALGFTDNMPKVFETFDYDGATIQDCLDWIHESETALKGKGARIFQSVCGGTPGVKPPAKPSFTGTINFF